MGAVIGREFAYDLLACATQADDVKLQAALSALHDAGLVLSRGTPPDATFMFKHALVRDAAYAQMLRDRRKEFHWRVAAALKELYPETGARQPELLAQHHMAGGRSKKPSPPHASAHITQH